MADGFVLYFLSNISGNQYEQCGDDNTVVIQHMAQALSSHRLDLDNKQDKSYSDFTYESCVHLSSVNPSTIYQFNINNLRDIHPRHCLELCNRNRQKYALLNRNKCLCTNKIPGKSLTGSATLSSINFNCTQECPGNYLYKCGSPTNSSLYSVYTMEIYCPVGKNTNRQLIINKHLKFTFFFRLYNGYGKRQMPV